ncbi:endopeptidase La [Candidatus Beckwithbacteria bacterium RBG_13_42_9]|uniref:Lon protease n=1 Tax=Candidatus Beckwithbacteria bacterium RBG_13_42_9 TaxID=1797457 RepID=A0A1F5E8P2_9BACT|nr:MAG: endopeptidase La [Candidatus Beckwithbacteria bacterium RBG_13_42_9]
MTILSRSIQKPNNEKVVPLVPLREVVIFPSNELVLSFGRPKSIAGVEAAFAGNKMIAFVAQKDPKAEEPGINDLYKIATLCRIERLLRTNGEINALVKGLARVRLEGLLQASPHIKVRVSEIAEIEEQSNKITALQKHLSAQLKQAVNLGKAVDFLLFMKLMSGVSAAELTDQVAGVLDISTPEKQKLLELNQIGKRLDLVSGYLAKELKILEIEQSIASKTQKKFDKSMREAVLRERMKTIQKELGEEEEEDDEIKELKLKIKKSQMPEDIEAKATKELNRLAKMHSFNPEAAYIRTYLDWLVDLPWNKESDLKVSLKKAEKVLDEDHYGLQKIKERIIEHLAVLQLKKNKKRFGKQVKKTKSTEQHRGSTILCFVGPPGVGKTSIGRSIAKALGRKFIKVSLGGIRDEAEIRGHRRTYVGAMPGRIIQGVKDTGTKNPVFMLDEIDKVGADFRGDPSSALLEALDPEQNFAFSDHYLEVPFDLSEVFFITTANVLDTIPPALRDRLEIIEFSGYTEDEKFNIAQRYLINKALEATGLKKNEVNIPGPVLKRIIRRYTREAGVRNLERQITKIMRKVARQIASGKKIKARLSLVNLSDYLGPDRFSENLAEKKDEVGMATGLAWTQAGGDVLFIEVALMPGKGNLLLTGKLGTVMKESCKAALSYIRSHWRELKLKEDFGSQYDFHIHVPEGAVPKDGPSAGVAITTALFSALSRKKVKRDVGMTGEITLRGRVLEIGGIKEKLIAAHRAGLKKVVLPADNEKDMVEVPAKVKKDLQLKFVKELDQALREAIVNYN